MSTQSPAVSARSVPRATGIWPFVGRFRVELGCFPLVAGVYVAHLFVSGYNRFYYDSAVYWQLGHSFEHNGHFSLTAYHVAPGGYPRGYSLPLLYHGLQVMASWVGAGPITIVKLFGALLAATIGVVVAPRLARQLFPSVVIGVGPVLALNALLFLFWRDHFNFPLSDFPALLAAGTGLIGLLRGSKSGYVIAGVGLALAANMRPAYVPALVVAVFVTAAIPFRSWNLRTRGVAVSLLLVGVLVASLPQALINHHQGETWSPTVPGGKQISLLQLSDGMLYQRYETYVGAPHGYPQPQVFYDDPSTRHVLRREHVSSTRTIFGQPAPITGYSQYLRIVRRQPAEMAAAYARRTFNGLDVWYPTPYVRDLSDRSIVLSLLQYTLVFVALASVSLSEARRALGPIRWAGIAILVTPCLPAVSGAVEPRFFLPLQLLLYMLVCFGMMSSATMLGRSVRKRSALGAAYVAFVLVCVTLSSETLAQLQHPGLILGSRPALNPPAIAD